MDTEILGTDIVPIPADLARGAFLTGAEAWQSYRRGDSDAATFGVDGTANFGPSENRGNLVRDLAALVKVETLPWNERGLMTAVYEGATGPEYDDLLDDVATVIADDDLDAIQEVAEDARLRPPSPDEASRRAAERRPADRYVPRGTALTRPVAASVREKAPPTDTFPVAQPSPGQSPRASERRPHRQATGAGDAGPRVEAVRRSERDLVDPLQTTPHDITDPRARPTEAAGTGSRVRRA